MTPEQEEFWQAFLTDHPDVVASEGSVIAGTPGSPDIADRLIDLYLAGAKTAGSGLAEDYATAGDALPQVGDHWIALDGNGRPRLILRTDRVETHRFLDVPERIAIAEGEGDLSLAYWRRAHAQHYAPHLQEWGLRDINDATVVTEFFTLVHP
nr:ASCH domain-containing protein [Arsenicicoccus piscis]